LIALEDDSTDNTTEKRVGRDGEQPLLVKQSPAVVDKT
jgi:hypothetical protein